MDSLLTKLADELLVQDITEPSAVLGSLSNDDLQVFYDNVLEQFALALLTGRTHRRVRSCPDSPDQISGNVRSSPDYCSLCDEFLRPEGFHEL